MRSKFLFMKVGTLTINDKKIGEIFVDENKKLYSDVISFCPLAKYSRIIGFVCPTNDPNIPLGLEPCEYKTNFKDCPKWKAQQALEEKLQQIKGKLE